MTGDLITNKIIGDMGYKVFPSIAPEKTLQPYLVYDFQIDVLSTKDGCGFIDNLKIRIYTNTYKQGVEIRNNLHLELLNYSQPQTLTIDDQQLYFRVTNVQPNECTFIDSEYLTTIDFTIRYN